MPFRNDDTILSLVTGSAPVCDDSASTSVLELDLAVLLTAAVVVTGLGAGRLAGLTGCGFCEFVLLIVVHSESRPFLSEIVSLGAVVMLKAPTETFLAEELTIGCTGFGSIDLYTIISFDKCSF